MSGSSTNQPQPNRPNMRPLRCYAALQDKTSAQQHEVQSARTETIVQEQILTTGRKDIAINPRPQPNELFTMTLSVTSTEEPMDEPPFLIDLIFKPNESGHRLRPAETQLLLSYIGEILREIEDEEKPTVTDNGSIREETIL